MAEKAASLLSPTGKRQVLRAVRPNVALEERYRAKLEALIDDLNRSVTYWLTSAYRNNEPATMTQDRSAADVLNAIMNKLARRWLARFSKLAPEMAKWFATSAAQRSDAALKAALKKGGMTVAFRPTPAQKDALQATLAENVGLIKSIPQQYLQEVQGLVNRSVAAGRDLSFLRDELQKRYAITRRRAETISRDQNNKATAVLTKARQTELGITHATWQHSHGGKHPRPEHVKASGKPYEIAKGMYLEGKWTWPGVEINCRCVSRSILPKAA